MSLSTYDVITRPFIFTNHDVILFSIEQHSGISAATQAYSAILANLSGTIIDYVTFKLTILYLDMQQALFDFRRDLVEAKRLILMLMARRDELLQIWMKHLEAKEVIKMLDKMCVIV